MSDTPETPETPETPASALEENISRKGANSYYYAHGKKIDGPQWDGREEPRLLGTSPAPQVTRLTSTLDEFSWLDGAKHVKVYVEFDTSEVAEEDITLDSDEFSFTFKFTAASKPYILSIGPLHAEVEESSFVKKSDKFIIKLKKKVEATWYQLKKV